MRVLDLYLQHDNPKIQHIFRVTTRLLLAEGAADLSMRKIAVAAQMSLSNVQYYFKTKELLLGDLLQAFLRAYMLDLQQQFERDYAEETAQVIIQMTLKRVLERDDFHDCLTLFKEIWLLAEYNEQVRIGLEAYYSNLFQLLRLWLEQVLPIACSEQDLKAIVSLVIPYIEGYYLTQAAIPLEAEALSALLTRLILYILKLES